MYLEEWLPVFLAKSNPIWTRVNVFDFFAGPGQDQTGQPGTPGIILEAVARYKKEIEKNHRVVTLYFNEKDPVKFKQLKSFLHSYDHEIVHFKIENAEFKSAFDGWLIEMKGAANLLILDQNGIKHITEEVFHQIIDLDATDFLFFTSSSTIRRFGEVPTITQYIKVDRESLQKKPYDHIHRVVLEYYKSLIPASKQYFLAPFSLRKGPNIYGLIFGSGHPLGMEKFLRTCWKQDPLRGEANYDLDSDQIDIDAPSLFKELDKPKKLQRFETELTKKILSNQLKTNGDVYLFTLTNGFTPKHAHGVLTQMKKEGLIRIPKNFELKHQSARKNAMLTTLEIVKKNG
jgi:three-Cys-motif partner protein